MYDRRDFLLEIEIFICLATDYLCELNKEKQQLTSQLEAKQKETYCLRAVQKFVCLFVLLVD